MQTESTNVCLRMNIYMYEHNNERFYMTNIDDRSCANRPARAALAAIHPFTLQDKCALRAGLWSTRLAPKDLLHLHPVCATASLICLVGP